MVFRNKAQCAGNGRTLAKHCTKSRRPEATRLTAEHHRSALRVSLSRPTASPKAPTFGAPLDKGAAIAFEARLAVNLDELTELAIIILKEHSSSATVNKDFVINRGLTPDLFTS